MLSFCDRNPELGARRSPTSSASYLTKPGTSELRRVALQACACPGGRVKREVLAEIGFLIILGDLAWLDAGFGVAYHRVYG